MFDPSYTKSMKELQPEKGGLRLGEVSKSFGGKKVVDRLSLCLDTPGVYGLLGTNGAGKTTTIRMLLGIMKRDSGTITWSGTEVDRKTVNFGYLPEERGIYPKIKIYDQLSYFAELKGMTKSAIAKSIQDWAERLRVTEYLQLPAEKLSKGNQQKIQFMTAVLHDPDLIVLDEPFSGLDPVNTEILKTMIMDLVQMGKFIIMSAHQMATIEEFCSEILILNRGKTVLQGNLEQIKRRYPVNRLKITTEEDIASYLKDFKIESVHDNKYVLRIKNESSARELLSNLVESKVEVNKFEIMRPTLNDIFIEKVGAANLISELESEVRNER